MQGLTDYWLMSDKFDYEDGSAHVIADIPAGTLVIDALCVITTPFAGTSPTVDIGDGDGADDWVDNGDVTEGTAGSYRGTSGNGAAYSATGKYYTSAGQIKVTIGGTNLSAGEGYALLHCVKLPL